METPVSTQADNVTPIVPEKTFTHVLQDGTRITVGPTQGVIRLRLRDLLEDLFKDDEMRAIGAAFLSIRTWSNGPPSPLNTRLQFEGLMTRFGTEESLDEFMEKWNKLTQPVLTRTITEVMSEALDKNWNENQIRDEIARRTEPMLRERLNRLRD